MIFLNVYLPFIIGVFTYIKAEIRNSESAMQFSTAGVQVYVRFKLSMLA